MYNNKTHIYTRTFGRIFSLNRIIAAAIRALLLSTALCKLLDAQANPSNNNNNNNGQTPSEEYSGAGATQLTEADMVYAICFSSSVHAGSEPYYISPALVKMAQEWADQMNQNGQMSHDNYPDRFKNSGFIPAPKGITGSENIAAQNGHVDATMKMWMESQTHRENIQNQDFRYMGIARNGDFWVQVMGSAADDDDGTKQDAKIDCTGFNEDITQNKAIKFPEGFSIDDTSGDGVDIDTGGDSDSNYDGGSNDGYNDRCKRSNNSDNRTGTNSNSSQLLTTATRALLISTTLYNLRNLSFTLGANAQEVPSEYSNSGSKQATEADIVYAICLSSTIHTGGQTYFISQDLMKMAQEWADQMNQNGQMSHDNYPDRFKNSGFQPGPSGTSGGENVAQNATVDLSVKAWMNHEGHKENIQNQSFKYMGIARSGDFWAQEMGSAADDDDGTKQGAKIDCTGFNEDITQNKAIKFPEGFSIDGISSGGDTGSSNGGSSGSGNTCTCGHGSSGSDDDSNSEGGDDNSNPADDQQPDHQHNNDKNMAPEPKTIDEFKTEIAGDYVLVDFYATWCMPCRMIAPKLPDLEKEFPPLKVVKVNIEDAAEVAAENQITAMPTFHLYHKGNKVAEMLGADFKKLKDLVAKNLPKKDN
ncbi:thioredoxin trx1 [Mycoemilia scoparia]|uniref:Thioredoxin trx1 n=1 Tax=Mycoemilia scoparia TaxID=417184 RepID=A0A9W7ZVL8_9FUNG|nr:thioredoxin trx1 [Mycoemilia scoparia]